MVDQEDLETDWVLITDTAGVEHAAEELDRGSGPIGVDAERASGFRYGSDAYLVQMHRHGGGTFLFDPTTIDSFAAVKEAIGAEEWILHAASQDLESLTAIDLAPQRLFDTELASRLLGFDRVGLGSVVEQLLGIRLKKAHSAADWSIRPLPTSWLEYAALDVALLPDLRDAIAAHLEEQEKSQIAEQEFQAVLTKPARQPLAEPWRRLSGSSALRSPRDWAIARELWFARDQLAQGRDIAPGRLIPDRSIIAASLASPRSKGHLAGLSEFTGQASRTDLELWWNAVLRGKTTEDLPGRVRREPDAIPHHRNWGSRYPEAAVRLSAARDALAEEAERHNMPPENLLTPDFLRRIAWQPPEPLTVEAVSERLRELGARQWQVQLTAPVITAAIVGVQ